VATVTKGVEVARQHNADCIVSVGGGSVIDLGKAISGLCNSDGAVEDFLELGGSTPRSLNAPLPFMAVPTTAGTGAEATRNAVIGVPDRHAKISLRDPRLIPDVALIDPALTDHSPNDLTLASGLDAITQLIESYLCNRANPVTDAICAGMIPNAIAALATLMEAETPAARDTMARASYLSGVALANSGLGVVHGLASIIGAMGAPHGAICGRLLAPALRINSDVAATMRHDLSKFQQVERWLAEGLVEGGTDGVHALQAFVDRNGLPTTDALGVTDELKDQIAEKALTASSTRANPVDLTKNDVLRILNTADRS